MANISVNWVSHHRRSDEVAEALELTPYYVDNDSPSLIVRYAMNWLETRRIVKQEKPRVCVVMQPPIVALFALLPYALTHRCKLVVDVHSGVLFDPKWRWGFSLLARIAARTGGAVVPNSELADGLRQRSVDTVLITNLVRLAEFAPDLPDQVAEFRGSYVLAPLAYAHDEPIEEILEAARATPNIVWVLTGKAPKGLMDTSPPNIIYPGYVSRDHYQALVANSALIVGLTTKESTMQSAGFEAIAAGKPFVTSDTRVLREYFENAAVYTSIDADEIAGNVTAVLQNIDDWTKRMAARREDRIAIQRIQVENARQWIGKLASTSK